MVLLICNMIALPRCYHGVAEVLLGEYRVIVTAWDILLLPRRLFINFLYVVGESSPFPISANSGRAFTKSIAYNLSCDFVL